MEEAKAQDVERDLFILERKAERGILWDAFVRSQGWMDRDATWIVGLARHLALPARFLGRASLIGLYTLSSDSGRSIVLPAWWLAAIGAMSHWGYWSLRARARKEMSLWNHDLVSFTLGNMLPLAGSLSPARKDILLRLFPDGAERIKIPLGIELLSTAQGLLGAVFLFLLLLAVRNYFRMR